VIVKPTRASDYAPKQVALVRAVCLLIATKLGDLMDELVVVGGLVPSLIIDQSTLSPETDTHVGTMDLDVGLTLAIFDEKRYEALAERLRRAGFVPDTNEEGRLTHQRWKVKDSEHVTVDFLIPPSDDRDRGGRLKRIQSDFAAIVTPVFDWLSSTGNGSHSQAEPLSVRRPHVRYGFVVPGLILS